MNWKVITWYIGISLLLVAALMTVSGLIACFTPGDDSRLPLFFSALLTGSVGAFPLIFAPKRQHRLSFREGNSIVVGAWISACLFGMLPFLFHGGEFTPVNAIFESVSGFTTTGASILNDIEGLPRGLQFWRIATAWVGGVGIVTLFSMLPIVLMSFRHGAKWGLLTAFVHSLLQLIMGIKNVGYCATLGAQIACILLDYVCAFSVLGLASAFSKPIKNRAVGVCTGTAVVCLLRFVCHFLSGIYLWGSYKEYYDWAANMSTPIYSLVYNGNYMLPELIITVIGAVLLVRGASRLFDRQSS